MIGKQWKKHDAFRVGNVGLPPCREEDSVHSLHSNDDVVDERQGHPDKNANKAVAEAGIGAKESKAVRWIRSLAIAVIVLSTIGVALAVYYYMANSEKKTFAYRFKSDSFKILESIGSTFDRSLGAVDTFAVNLVSTAKQSHQTWPFVTLSDFPVKSSKILTLSKGVLFSTFTFVTHQQRAMWNNYTFHNDEWVDESLDVQELALNKTYFGPINRNWTKAEDIVQNEGVAIDNDVYWVSWQQYPVVPTPYYAPYSWDYWPYLDVSGKKMLETHQPVISSAFNLPNPNNPEEVAYVEDNAFYYRDYLPPDRDPTEPYSDMLYVSTFAFARSLSFVRLPCSHFPLLHAASFEKNQRNSD
jgi:hypothetical protein